MLKIKSDIDLKELEKYEFKYSESKNEYYRYFYESDLDGDEIRIGKDRIIRNWTCLELADDSYCGESPLEGSFYKIVDLIDAGLVEKVKEK